MGPAAVPISSSTGAAPVAAATLGTLPATVSTTDCSVVSPALRV